MIVIVVIQIHRIFIIWSYLEVRIRTCRIIPLLQKLQPVNTFVKLFTVVLIDKSESADHCSICNVPFSFSINNPTENNCKISRG